MPATITHAYFSKDVFDILPSNIKNVIDCSRIKMFGQSSLLFFLYEIHHKIYESSFLVKQKTDYKTLMNPYFVQTS